ncbi:hypothetical protein FRB96_000811 [Tulasnella sp. 330]|nr:hypothetical protein FRB96_000811 [Tulasnella sp. 330]KAG8881944.1 hypothetical protein FRB97_008902 [Tulasnella sp. 331]KAG8887954.1 hypothetical protein FRB98_008712 [Tulasnella sp. 332]
MANGTVYGLVHDECRKRKITLTTSVLEEGEQNSPKWVMALTVDNRTTYTGGPAKTKKSAMTDAALKLAAALGMEVPSDLI